MVFPLVILARLELIRCKTLPTPAKGWLRSRECTGIVTGGWLELQDFARPLIETVGKEQQRVDKRTHSL